MRYQLCVSIVLSALCSTYAGASNGIMRKEKESDEHDLPELVRKEAAAEVSSSGAASALQSTEQEEAATRAKLAAHLTSYAQLQQSYRDMSSIMSALEKEDTVIDGFVQPRVTLKERMEELHRGEKAESVLRQKTNEEQGLAALTTPAPPTPEQLASLAERQKESSKVNYKDSIQSGGTYGYWAEDRPHELRLDPENMKVYSFSTYKLKYPTLHSWNIEGEWKKLPKVPHKVKRNKAKGGASLLDASGQELVFVRDKNGYYHQGREPPSQLEMLKKRKPLDWQKFLPKTDEQLREEERFKIFPNHTGSILMAVDQFKNAKTRAARENVRDMLTSVRSSIAMTMKMKPKHEGRAFLNIIGSTGSVTGYEVEVGQVKVGALKKKIEEEKKIPAETQQLYYGGVELLDDDMLGKFVPAGERALDLITGAKSAHKLTNQKPAEKTSASLLEKPAVKSSSKPAAKIGDKKANVKALAKAVAKAPSTKAAAKPAAKAASAKHEKKAEGKHPAAKASPAKAAAAKAVPAKAEKAKVSALKSAAKAAPAKAEKAKVSTLKAAPAKGAVGKAVATKAVPAKEAPAKATTSKADPAKVRPAKAAPAKAAKGAAEKKKSRAASLLETGEQQQRTKTKVVRAPPGGWFPKAKIPKGVLEAQKSAKYQERVAVEPKTLRRTLYVREEDGTIHVEKQEIATKYHSIKPLEQWGYYRGRDPWMQIDRGIPLEVLLEDDKEEEEKERKQDSTLVK